MQEFRNIATLELGDFRVDIAPEFGLSVVRFEWRGIEMLDRSTQDAFLRVRKGLGPLILPHFNQEAKTPEVDRGRFSHIQELQRLGVSHPFQHGIARYVPWQVSVNASEIIGSLSSAHRYRRHLLRDLVGFDFVAQVAYRLTDAGLEIDFDVAGEKPVAAGIHFYYDAVERERASVSLSEAFTGGEQTAELSEPINRVYRVKSEARDHVAHATLVTPTHTLTTRIRVGGPAESSFQSVVVFSPPDSSFVCVEPISYDVGDENSVTRFRGQILLEPGSWQS